MEIERKDKAPVNHWILRICFGKHHYRRIFFSFPGLSGSWTRHAFSLTHYSYSCVTYFCILELTDIRAMKRGNSRKAGKGHYLPLTGVQQKVKSHEIALIQFPMKDWNIRKLIC